MTHPLRQTAHLRWGRVSRPGASYFLTLCTKSRAPILADFENATRTAETWAQLHTSGDIALLAATVMPDHVHGLFTLGDRLSFGQVMAKFKNFARNHGCAPWRWQDDGFEHQLRPAESPEDYAFYVFMNPYRAGLITTRDAWPWWQCPARQRFAFASKLSSESTPLPEWLGDIELVAKRITTGE